MHLDQPEVLNDCTYFVVGYKGNWSSLEKQNSLRDHFEVTKQVRSISLTTYNDNIMCTIFGDVVEHILQYWMNVFDNSSSELLFDLFNNDLAIIITIQFSIHQQLSSVRDFFGHDQNSCIFSSFSNTACN